VSRRSLRAVSLPYVLGCRWITLESLSGLRALVCRDQSAAHGHRRQILAGGRVREAACCVEPGQARRRTRQYTVTQSQQARVMVQSFEVRYSSPPGLLRVACRSGIRVVQARTLSTSCDLCIDGRPFLNLWSPRIRGGGYPKPVRVVALAKWVAWRSA